MQNTFNETTDQINLKNLFSYRKLRLFFLGFLSNAEFQQTSKMIHFKLWFNYMQTVTASFFNVNKLKSLF